MSSELTAVVAKALDEDLGSTFCDITTESVVRANSWGVAELRAKAPGIIAGLAAVGEVFRQMDPRVS
ncbi:MAG: carboxylating nicotinate-nucleotide diphosphorylase, partial [Candidatus Dormibacteraceae bacterium]